MLNRIKILINNYFNSETAPGLTKEIKYYQDQIRFRLDVEKRIEKTKSSSLLLQGADAFLNSLDDKGKEGVKGFMDDFSNSVGLTPEVAKQMMTGVDKRFADERSSDQLYQDMVTTLSKFVERILNIADGIEEITDDINDILDNYYEKLPIERKKDDFEKDRIEYIKYLLDRLLDFKNLYEYRQLEKLYYGETYAQYYEKFGDYDKGVCLQNDWAHHVRASCENTRVKVGNFVVKGCEYPYRNVPDRCGLRYNYDKHVCEPSQSYCRAFGIGPVQRTSKDHKVKLKIEKNGQEKEYDAGSMPVCKNNIGQEIAEFILGTTVFRSLKDLACSMDNECCHHLDCMEKIL